MASCCSSKRGVPVNSVDLGEAHKAGAWSYEKSVPTIRWLDPRGVQRLSNQPRSLLPGHKDYRINPAVYYLVRRRLLPCTLL